MYWRCLFAVLGHKRNQGLVDLLRVRGAEEVRAPFDRDELRVGRVDELLNLLLRVGHGVDNVVGALLAVSILSQGSRYLQGKMILTCNHITGQRTSASRPCRPSRSRRLMAAMRIRRRPSSPR